MLSAFLYAERIYKKILIEYPLGELKGALSLPFNVKELKAQKSLKTWLDLYPGLGLVVNAERATNLAGIPIDTECLFIPGSGWVNSQALCHFLISDKNISVINNTEMNEFIYRDERWYLGEYTASVLILANGFKVNQFIQTNNLPVKAIRGQMTALASTPASQRIKIPICAEGHILPVLDSSHFLGATYESGATGTEVRPKDDEFNRDRLRKISDINWSEEITGNWVGIRGSTPDYLPLVGPIAKADEFNAQYAGLESNANRWISTEPAYFPNLYAFAGFGSRGLTTIPLSAEWLAAHLNNEISAAPRNLLQALAPSRFLRRNITRGLF